MYPWALARKKEIVYRARAICFYYTLLVVVLFFLLKSCMMISGARALSRGINYLKCQPSVGSQAMYSPYIRPVLAEFDNRMMLFFHHVFACSLISLLFCPLRGT
jgi:hypothetical protein